MLAVCGLLAIAWPISRKLLLTKPAPPPATAPLETRRQFWRSRIKADVADREAYLQLGILEERGGYYLSARRNLESARALGVSDVQICGPLGRAQLQLAQLDAAEKEFTKAVQLAPDSLEAALNLAGFFVTARQSRRANELLAAIWSRKGKELSSPERDRLALAFLDCNDLRHALEVAVATLETDPNNKNAAMTAARCALSLDDAKSARRYVELALKDTEDAAAAHYFYGLVLRKLGDSDAALKAWQKANREDPTLTDVYERIGEEYAKRKDFRKAAYAMERVALTTKSLEAMVRTAAAYRKANLPDDAAYWDAAVAGVQGNFPAALALGQKAARSQNSAVRRRGLSAIAEAYLGMKKKKEYLAAMLEATKARSADDLLALSTAYETLNEYDKYIACLREVIVKDPAQEADIRYRLAMTLSKTGQRDQAEKDLERAVALQPENATYSLELAAIYLKTSNVGDHLAKATELSQNAARSAPTEEAAWRTLGQCYAASNQLPRAAQCLEHAIDLEAGRGATYLELSRVYARMGNAEDSKEMVKLYQKYIGFEQQRSTVELRAKRENATVADLTTYGDLQLNLGNSDEAVRAYERAFILAPKDPTLKTTLTQLYQRLNLPDRLARLQEKSK